MALGDGSVWDESNPQQSTLVNQGPLYETDFKVGVRSRMANEHVWPSSQSSTASGGQHSVVSFQGQSAQPVMPLVGTTTQAAMMYFNTAGNGYIQDSAGNVHQFYVSGGGIGITSTSTIGAIPVVTGSGGLAVLSPGSSGQTLVSQGTTGSPVWSSLSWGATSSGLSLSTAYQITADGTVLVLGTAGGGAGGGITVLSDTVNPPTTTRGQNAFVSGLLYLNVPVKSGNYFKVITGGTVTIAFIEYWPL